MKDTLKFYNDFPKQGVVFVDIIPFLQDKKTFRQLVDELGKCLTAPNIAAPEARGFLFTAPLLVTDPRVENIIPIRKSGKLPFAEGDLCEVKVEKEYGFDKLYYRISDIAAGRADDGLFHIEVEVGDGDGTWTNIRAELTDLFGNTSTVAIDGSGSYAIQVTSAGLTEDTATLRIVCDGSDSPLYVGDVEI